MIAKQLVSAVIIPKSVAVKLSEVNGIVSKVIAKQSVSAIIILESVTVKLSKANGTVLKVIIVSANFKLSEKKEMDKFLDKTYK